MKSINLQNISLNYNLYYFQYISDNLKLRLLLKTQEIANMFVSYLKPLLIGTVYKLLT